MDVAYFGIVCTDISGYTTKPKSERASGNTGEALQGFFAYLKACAFHERPRCLILECVARLGHARKVDPDVRTGAEYIKGELEPLGYQGSWDFVNPKQFWLPQSRPRVYGLFLRVSEMSEHGIQARLRQVEAALLVVKRLQGFDPHHPLAPSSSIPLFTPRGRIVDRADGSRPLVARLCGLRPFEPLAETLARCRATPSFDSRTAVGKGGGQAAGPPQQKWPHDHAAFLAEHGLSQADVQEGLASFQEVAGKLLSSRQLEALWLHLVLLRVRKGVQWQSRVLVAAVGASIRFLTLSDGLFPCVTPHMVYCILEHGRVYMANGLHLLAMQGVQLKEVARFHLDAEEDPLLRDLAGNAFTGNIAAAYALGAYSVL